VLCRALSSTTIMKPLRPLLALVLLATSSAAIPAALRVDNAPEYPLSLESSEELNWNLQDRRLVQFAPDAEPVWITELEKVIPALMSHCAFLMKE
jgi:hypothetical protein